MKFFFTSILSCMVMFSCVCLNVRAKDNENFNYDSEFKLMDQMPRDKNFMFSPLSIKCAFMLIANGSENKVQHEILNFFCISDLNKSNKQFRRIFESLIKTGVVNIVNSVWLNKDEAKRWGSKDIKFNDKYINKIKKYFNSEALEVNDKNAVSNINNWVSDKTHGKINSIIDNSDFLSMIVNALYFKADWKSPFKQSDTQKLTFSNKDGREIEVDFMCKKGSYLYFEDNDMQFLEIPYETEGLSMYIVLPRVGKEITKENFENAMRNKVLESVEIKLPRFKTTTSLSMAETMKKLSIQEVFSLECLDMNNIMYKGLSRNTPTFISNVIHKSFIEVNEKGTEAAAVTAVSNFCVAPLEISKVDYKIFNANHPFKYMIRDNKSGELLFMGEQAFFN